MVGGARHVRCGKRQRPAEQQAPETIEAGADLQRRENAAVTAFLAALFHQNRKASSEEEEEVSLQPSTTTAAGKRGNAPQMLMDWTRSISGLLRAVYLKTHKDNKHGIYTDSIIPSSGGPSPTKSTSSSAGRAGSTTTLTSSSNGPPLSFGPPVSLTVGGTSDGTFHHDDISVENHLSQLGIYGCSDVVIADADRNDYRRRRRLKERALCRLMDFSPLWWTPVTTPPITTVNTSTLVALYLIPMVAIMNQHIPGGIVNPEAYCDFCQNEFCNCISSKDTKPRCTASFRQMKAEHRDIGASSSGSSHKRSKTNPIKNPSSSSGRGKRDIRRASDNNLRYTDGRHHRESVLRNLQFARNSILSADSRTSRNTGSDRCRNSRSSRRNRLRLRPE